MSLFLASFLFIHSILKHCSSNNVLDVLAAIKVGSANYFSLLATVIYLLIVFISVWVCLLGMYMNSVEIQVYI